MTNSNDDYRRDALPRRVLLLLTSRSYRTRAFIEAAERLGIEVVKAVDMQEHLADYWNYPLGLDYSNVEKAGRVYTFILDESSSRGDPVSR